MHTSSSTALINPTIICQSGNNNNNNNNDNNNNNNNNITKIINSNNQDNSNQDNSNSSSHFNDLPEDFSFSLLDVDANDANNDDDADAHVYNLNQVIYELVSHEIVTYKLSLYMVSHHLTATIIVIALQDSNDDCPLSLFDYDVLSSLISSNDGEGCF
jgi:hypothetical protein